MPKLLPLMTGVYRWRNLINGKVKRDAAAKGYATKLAKADALPTAAEPIPPED